MHKTSYPATHAQLKNFYGPLLAAVSATKSAYDALVAQHSPDATRGGFQAAVRTCAAEDGLQAACIRLFVQAARARGRSPLYTLALLAGAMCAAVDCSRALCACPLTCQSLTPPAGLC